MPAIAIAAFQSVKRAKICEEPMRKDQCPSRTGVATVFCGLGVQLKITKLTREHFLRSQNGEGEIYTIFLSIYDFYDRGNAGSTPFFGFENGDYVSACTQGEGLLVGGGFLWVSVGWRTPGGLLVDGGLLIITGCLYVR